MGITAELARWSQALVGIAQTGLNYANNPYDVERYEEMLKLAGEMTATINAEATLDTTLADRLAWGWRQQVAQGKKGYVTPNVSVGAIIFNEHNELLLVRNATAGFWIFPVGNADVGYTSENSIPVRLLFALRRLLGKLFGWDKAPKQSGSWSFHTRLTDSDRQASLVPPGTRDGPFQVLYVHTQEAVSEIRNARCKPISSWQSNQGPAAINSTWLCMFCR